MAVNPRNHGIAIGRLTRDPTVLKNVDGSHKVMFTLAVQNNFKSGPDKTKGTNFVAVEAFVSAGKEGLGVYDYMHKGDLIGVEYSVRSSSYERDGKTFYTQTLLVQSVDLMERKRTTDARHTKNDVKAQAADADPVPPIDEDDWDDEDAPLSF